MLTTSSRLLVRTTVSPSVGQVRYRRTKKSLRRPLGKPKVIREDNDDWIPSVDEYNKIQQDFEAKRKERILEKGVKPINTWRSHISLMVDANKRDLWAQIAEWDQKEAWHPGFVTESSTDLNNFPEETNNWLNDKERVVRDVETGETYTEGLCEVLPLSRHMTFDIHDPNPLPFQDYVCTLKVTAWGDHKSVFDWVSNYRFTDVESNTQTDMNNKAREAHQLLTKLALGVKFTDSESGEGAVAATRLRSATTQVDIYIYINHPTSRLSLEYIPIYIYIYT